MTRLAIIVKSKDQVFRIIFRHVLTSCRKVAHRVDFSYSQGGLLAAGKRSNEKAVGDKVKVRICLRCEKNFKSYSKYNKLCLDCKKSPDFTMGMFTNRDES